MSGFAILLFLKIIQCVVKCALNKKCILELSCCRKIMEYTKSQKYKNHGKKYCIMMVDVVEIPVGSTAALASPWDNNYFTYVTREWRWPL